MTTSALDLINETTRYLYSGARDPQNRLELGVSAGDDVLTLSFNLASIQEGAVLAVGLELMYVWEVVSPVNKTVRVARGYLGSTDADHDSAEIVTVNPKFSFFSIFQALNADLDALSGMGLFQIATVSKTYNASVQGYDLTGATNVLQVLQVKYDDPGPAKLWPEIKSYKLRRASDTTDFSSGDALVVYEGGQPGAALRITFATTFTRFTGLTDTVESTGLPSTAFDLPPLGAALRLQYLREGQRNFNESQPGTRRATEVPVGAQLQGAVGIERLRGQRIRTEVNKLRKLWPNQRKF